MVSILFGSLCGRVYYHRFVLYITVQICQTNTNIFMAKNLIKLFFSYSESEQIYAILLDIKKKYIREIWNGK